MIRELAAGETHLAYKAMLELRPAVGDEAAFVKRIDGVQRLEGYRLVASFVEGDEQAAAVAGFRVVHYIAWGDALYCDDLGTRPEHRGHGHAGKLIDWMIDEARRVRCGQFHLDSGVGDDRQDAHRLYFNKGMRISAYHFSRPV
ncbi:MAG TPA: GNAT family N-acetyltransferase [Candidatus Dormibacteraeota bacterium]|nr:GNAT family N-acetyltransferase [Candidatus Dormibacteraeota bacterium]